MVLKYLPGKDSLCRLVLRKSPEPNIAMNLPLAILIIGSTIMLGCGQSSTNKSGNITSEQAAVDTFIKGFNNPIDLPPGGIKLPPLDSLRTPNVAVEVYLAKTKFKFGEDILVTITLRNNTNKVQSVFFDRQLHNHDYPAMTSVKLINKVSGKSVLKYDSWAFLSSDLLSIEEIIAFSYRLNPTQHISNRFSLASLAPFKSMEPNLPKGSYELQIFYWSNGSNIIDFMVL